MFRFTDNFEVQNVPGCLCGRCLNQQLLLANLKLQILQGKNFSPLIVSGSHTVSHSLQTQ